MCKKITLMLCLLISATAFGQKLSTEDYIKLYKDLAIENMKFKKVPASITLAQGILESASGNSSLATKANNHFGIKCHKGWTGGTMYIDDDAPNECFRKYGSVLESFNDHADFLTGRERYAGLFLLDILDYKGWAQGLKDAGYATNPKYPMLLSDLIEKYKLYEFDKLALNPDYLKDENNNQNNSDNSNNNSYNGKSTIVFVNGLKAVKVRRGQTKEKIATEFEMNIKQLEKFNEIGTGDPLFDGEILFLEPKRTSAEPGKDVHTVKQGETFYSISHLYGMKMESLMKKNNMWYGSVIKTGDQLHLRKKKQL